MDARKNESGLGVRLGGLLSKRLGQDAVPGEFVVQRFFRCLQQFSGLRHVAGALAQGGFDNLFFGNVDLAG